MGQSTDSLVVVGIHSLFFVFLLDLGAILNFKDTPKIFQMSLGVSYRLNLYKES